jgi:4-amino-4-deoxy-L-arabinose transferase-like glycosyltransferase
MNAESQLVIIFGWSKRSQYDERSIPLLFLVDNKRMRKTAGKTSSTRRVDLVWLLALLITLAAFFTHLYRLGSLWPVPYFDPAYNGLDALRVVRRGVTPIFFPTNGGREPLFLYLQALAIRSLGTNSFALRLPGALAGALTVPLLYGFARTLLANKEGRLLKWVPAWAALGLALSVWGVSQTREGLRAAILPLISVGVMWLFVIGWRKANLTWLAAAGALLGLNAYTYTAARFLPIVLILVVLPDLLTKPDTGEDSRTKCWLGLGVLALTSVIVFAPLGWYYVRHPAMFDERAASVMIWNVLEPDSGATLVGELALSIWRTLFWFARLPLPLFLGLVAGLVYALFRFRQFEYRLLPIWWLVMLLPAVLTTETPHLLRSLGAAPPAYLLTGLGLAAVAEWLIHRRPVASSLVLISGLLIIAISSLPPLWRYFHPTTRDPRAGIGTQALATVVRARAQNEIVYLPLSAYANPSLRFLLASEFERQTDWEISPSAGPVRLIQPAEGPDSPAVVRLSPDGRITLLPPLKSSGQKTLRNAVPSDQPITDRNGAVVGYEALLPATDDPALHLRRADFPADAAVIGLADLVGYSIDHTTKVGSPNHLAPGSPFWITTFWQAYGGASEDYDLLVRLIDDAGRQWAQADGPPLEGAYPTSMWQPGEKLADVRLLWVDPKAPPGRYWLVLAFYDYGTDSRLPVSGSSTRDTIYLAPLKAPLSPVTQTPNEVQPQRAQFGEVAQLLGYQVSTQPSEFTLTLYWQADVPDQVDYTVFVHVLDETGQLVMGQDNQPVNGSYPTGIWEPGEIVPDGHTFSTSDLPRGDYQLEIGMYVLETGERLPVNTPHGSHDPARRLLLTTPVEVR